MSEISSPQAKNRLREAIRQRKAAMHESQPLMPLQLKAWDAALQADSTRSRVLDHIEVIEIRGSIDPALLTRALQHGVSRTAALRLRFDVSASGKVTQTIQKHQSADVEWIDLSAESSPAVAAKEWIARAGGTRLTPKAAPLFRHCLLNVSSDRCFWFTQYSPLIVSGTAARLANRRIARVLAALLNAEVAELPDDESAWLSCASEAREYQYSPAFVIDREYWDRVLSTATAPSLSLHAARSTGGEAAVARACLPRDRAKALADRSAALQIPLDRLVIACASAYVHRATGSTEVVLGVPAPEASTCSAAEADTLPIGLSIRKGETIGQLARQVDERLRDTVAHRKLGIVGFPHYEGGEGEGRSPYRVVVQVDGAAPLATGEIAAVASTIHCFPTEVEDLLLRVRATADADIEIFVLGNPSRYEGWEVDAHARHLGDLLEAIARDSEAERVISELPWVAAEESRRLRIDLNQTQVGFDATTPLHRLFEMHAARSPDATALVCDEQVLSYGELNRRANRLARDLARRTVAAESRVGICMDRSIEMVVAILAVVKAGACYVPLDPGYPRARLQYMVEDSSVSLVLTRSAVSQPLSLGVPCLPVDSNQNANAFDSVNLGIEIAPRSLVYAIYTSGSTGAPKGVAIESQAILNRIDWMQKRYRLTSADCVLQKTPYTFDVSVWEFFWPLITGARLVLAKPGGHMDPGYLVELIQSERVTVLHFVPSMLNALLNAVSWAGCDSVRQLICSGEALSRELQDRFFAAGTHAALDNLYGPTEAAIDVSSWRCSPQSPLASVPIGAPIQNIRLFVADERLRLSPLGLAGHLLIAGVGLARGYLNRPGLTAERFRPDPFGLPGDRVYCTGDLARSRSDGNIEYLGRLDHQVKIRGFRIELGEIESVLRKHPNIREAVVVARDGAAGEPVLVAYVNVVNAIDESVLIDQLKSLMIEQLPLYMVPAAIVVLASLPLTSSGKVDRASLPAPDLSLRRAEYEPPEGMTEQLLATLWCRILKVQQVGRHDNFFTLGGHSLMTAQLMGRVRDAFRVDLPIRTFFDQQTIQAQAQAIDRAQKVSLEASAPLIAVSRQAPLRLSYAQQRLWFLGQYTGPSALYNIAQSLILPAVTNVAALIRALQTLFARHEALRTRFEARPNGVVQVIDSPELDLEVERVAQQQKVDEIRRAERFYLFDVSRDRLCRFRLLCNEADGGHYVLLMTMHHSIFDGWSQGLMLRELGVLYEAFVQGKPSPLPPLPIQYADYAHWQRENVTEKTLRRHADYWRTQLAGMPPLLMLPTDRPRPAEQTFRGGWEPITLSTELSDALVTLSRRHNVTLFMTLLAGYGALLSRYSGQDDVAIGTVTANRDMPETEDIVGFFVNALIMRLDLSKDPTVVELLRDTRKTALQGYAHQDMPFEYLVEQLKPERTLSHSPLFQVMFTMQNLPGQRTARPGERVLPPQNRGTMSAIREGEALSRFDLSLTLGESPWGIEGGFEYNADLFDGSTIRRLVRHFENLLEAMARSPEERVSRLDVLSPEERRQQLIEWNGRAVAIDGQRCAHELFEDWAARCPDSVAASHEGEELTYRELNEQANRLAHYLQGQGVRPGVLVGICIERSLDMLVGILGALKAGAAYVPLDPTHPAARLSYLLEDADPRLVLTSTSRLAELPLGDRKVFPLDADVRGSFLSSYSTDNIAAERIQLAGRDLAYVIYTSGSTGQPKGVPIRHESLCNYLDHARRSYLPESVVAAVASLPLGFDAAVTTLLAPLCAGKTVELLPEGDELMASLSERLFSADRPKLFKVTPAHLQALANLSAGRVSELPHILVIGGEELTPTVLLPWRNTNLPSSLYINEYGPTEATVGCSVYAVGPSTPASDDAGLASIPIGRAIQNTSLYVLGKSDQLLPANCVGELCIGGVGLSPGYRNRAELTQRKFVECAIDAGVPVRVYRSGDLVRWLPRGELEFVGRHDSQLKIRGYRIEAGEIESTLCGHPGISGAMALKQDEQLVAYLIPTPVQDAALRAWQRVQEHEEWSGILKRELSNGMMIGCRDVLELNELYHEIFSDQMYLRHGVRLDAGACVFDVGANIGVFGVFAGTISRGARIHAFEHAPALHPILAFNASLHDLNLTLNQGSISEVMADEDIDTIDLLKIDLPQSGLAVLSGLSAGDWAKTRQIVLKVHDGGSSIAAIAELLESHRFGWHVEHRESRRGTSIAYVYAIADRAGEARHGPPGTAVSQIWHDRRAFLSDVRKHVRERLPHYMAPNRFVILDKVPLSENGKIDVQALPSADVAGADADPGPPVGATETKLADLWADVLKVERIGRFDNFFELGGHSLLATQLVSRIRETFAIELPIRVLFDHQVLRSQAQAIEQHRDQQGEQLTPIYPVSRQLPQRLSFGQQRLWFLSQYLGPTALYNLPWGLQLRGPVRVDALSASLKEIVGRHEVLRTRFETRNGECVQVIDAADFSVQLETLSSRAALWELCLAEWQAPFDLSRDRLFRIRLLQLAGEDRCVLLVTMHHIVADGWSMGVLSRELLALYAAFSENRQSPLEPLPIQYADFAHWQRERLTGKALESELDYWRNQLDGLPPFLMLPTDRPRPTQQTYRGSRVDLALPSSLSDSLLTLGQRQGVTLFMTLLAGFAALLSRYSGQKDIAIGLPIANRTHKETEPLIGFFVNTLVLRTDLSEDPSVLDLLEQTRETALQAYAHQEIPFERLVEELNPERNTSRSPLFQVLFALQNVPMDPVSLPEVVVEPLTLDVPAGQGAGAARFDLSLIATQGTEHIYGQLEYNTDLFERSTIERLREHYRWVLESMVNEPERRISELSCWQRIATPPGQVVQLNGRARRTSLARLEAVLAAFEDVKEVAVADRMVTGGGVLCVAYVVPRSSDATDEHRPDDLLARLRQHIRAQSDRYVIPDEVVVLAALPRAPDGNVLHRELPDPRRIQPRTYGAPEGETEVSLAALWCDLLQLPRVGREDNFFALGGHSLVAARLMSRIRVVFATELPLRVLFESQTLQTQAAAIEKARGAQLDEGMRARFQARFQQNRQSLADYGGALDEGEI